jgi:hypothetical protein
MVRPAERTYLEVKVLYSPDKGRQVTLAVGVGLPVLMDILGMSVFLSLARLVAS